MPSLSMKSLNPFNSKGPDLASQSSNVTSNLTATQAPKATKVALSLIYDPRTGEMTWNFQTDSPFPGQKQYVEDLESKAQDQWGLRSKIDGLFLDRFTAQGRDLFKQEELGEVHLFPTNASGTADFNANFITEAVFESAFPLAPPIGGWTEDSELHLPAKITNKKHQGGTIYYFERNVGAAASGGSTT